ncbi:MAG: helix-turn-helix transcriptional regulator [Devosia sp.]
MVYNFSLDLKVARRRSSLSQSDCAHLLGIDHTRISRLEAGTSMPTMVELSILCLVFNRPVGGVAQDVILSILSDLENRLSSMPGCPENWPGRENRVKTLSSLADKLRALGAEDDE